VVLLNKLGGILSENLGVIGLVGAIAIIGIGVWLFDKWRNKYDEY